MATARATANVAVQALFSVPLHMKAIIDDIDVDNQGSSGPITAQLEDDFTQDISSAVPATVARSAFPFQMTVAQGDTASADKLTVNETACLGNVGVICDKTDVGCVIVVKYHLE